MITVLCMAVVSGTIDRRIPTMPRRSTSGFRGLDRRSGGTRQTFGRDGASCACSFMLARCRRMSSHRGVLLCCLFAPAAAGPRRFANRLARGKWPNTVVVVADVALGRPYRTAGQLHPPMTLKCFWPSRLFALPGLPRTIGILHSPIAFHGATVLHEGCHKSRLFALVIP